MASSYALPTSFPGSHAPGHFHTHSCPSDRFQSLNSITTRPPRMSGSPSSKQNANGNAHSRGDYLHQSIHENENGSLHGEYHSHEHDRSRKHSSPDHELKHGSSHGRPHLHRARASALAPLESNNWNTTSSSLGKQLVNPTLPSQVEAYEPLSSVDVVCHHGSGKSRFTTFLLRYTSGWPALHCIMTEKDSRRIFYFMTYVSGSSTAFIFHAQTVANKSLQSELLIHGYPIFLWLPYRLAWPAQ